MELDLPGLAPNHRYKLLTALVVPRPIAWITSIGTDGRVNAAPFSFFNVLGNRPPVVAFGAGDRPSGEPKDTTRNVLATREFVINLVDEDSMEAMHHTAAPFPPEVSEPEVLGLELLPSVKVKPPRLALSKVHLECTYFETVTVLDNQIQLGLVVHLHAHDGIIDPKTFHIDPTKFQGVGRLQGPGWYATTRDRRDLGRFPSVEARPPGGAGNTMGSPGTPDQKPGK